MLRSHENPVSFLPRDITLSYECKGKIHHDFIIDARPGYMLHSILFPRCSRFLTDNEWNSLYTSLFILGYRRRSY